MPVAAANGIQISYTDSGGQGPAVVFSHGYLLYYTMSGRQVAALAPRYRVITWDQRGHCGTRAAGAFTYWDSAADLLGLLDQLGVGRAVLAGMSQGGFVSLRAELTAPDPVRALVLIDREGGLGTGPPRRGMSSCTGPGWGTARAGAVSGRLDHLGPGPVGRLVRQAERAGGAVGAG